PQKADEVRYQTVFAKTQGSVAAPTAGLHFTQKILDQLKTKNVNQAFLELHVGAGTFAPVKSEKMANHPMHEEQFKVGVNTLTLFEKSKQLVAVGTTALRTLESLYHIGLNPSKYWNPKRQM